MAIFECVVPEDERKPLTGTGWWSSEALWESAAASTVQRPTEDAAFDRIRTACHDYEAAMQRKYDSLSYDVIRDLVRNKRASLGIATLTPVERDAVWGRPPLWVWSDKRGYWVRNAEWSEAVGM